MLCLFDKDIRFVSVRLGDPSNYTYETEKTSLAYGGPHKSYMSTKLQSRWITKAESSQMFMTFGVSSHHRATLSYRRQISNNW